MAQIGNFFSGAIPDPTSEVFETIAERGNVRIERIISLGQLTPVGECYDQPNDEWVMVLSGNALVSFIDSDERFPLSGGDYLMIPAHTRHRVEYTSTDETTLWLALHFNSGE